jgi:adenylate cyclase
VLKSKKLVQKIGVLTLSLSLGVTGCLVLLQLVWSQIDYQVLDYFWRKAAATGESVKRSDQVVYLAITDETYRYFGKSSLDRAGLARVNDALAELGAEAIAYDLIFSRASDPNADRQLVASIRNSGSSYLPVGFGISRKRAPLKRDEGDAFTRLYKEYLAKPLESGTGRPYFARRASLQLDALARAAKGTGHISAPSDEDGVYRHLPVLIKIDSLYFPALTLAMFLDYMEIPLDSITVEWGRQIRIPALADSYLNEEVVIPIDAHGLATIPYRDVWGRDFPQMSAHSLLEQLQVDSLRDELEDIFSGSFVFIGEVSVGIADLGTTPLENDVPLVTIHAAMMNALLQHRFYAKWQTWPVLGLIAGIALLLGIAACFKHNRLLYFAGAIVFVGLFFLAWHEITRFSLFPLMSVLRGVGVIFFGLVIGLQVATSKDQAFIRNAFSKYVPERVVSQLLANPDQLQLGGEERELTVMFCDLVGFTTISEKIAPPQLVRLLNDYFSEMTDIILEEGGIIDKYLGDAIMAEFGAPLNLPDHPVRAVHTALKMQKKLGEMKKSSSLTGLPSLHCRIGINTGAMVVGNMGSHQTFDYTVIGDAVNLASRLESANKFYGTSLMVSEATHSQLTPGIFRTRLLDIIKVKGKSRAISVYEVYGLVNDPTSNRAYEKGFAAYQARDFDFARQLFEQSLSCRPHDLAAKELLLRLDSLTPELLARGWDGAIALEEK